MEELSEAATAQRGPSSSEPSGLPETGAGGPGRTSPKEALRRDTLPADPGLLCHLLWPPLSPPICRADRERGCPTASFQAPPPHPDASQNSGPPATCLSLCPRREQGSAACPQAAVCRPFLLLPDPQQVDGTPGLRMLWASGHWKPQPAPCHWPWLQEPTHLVPAPSSL